MQTSAVLILAAGEHRRWKAQYPKQLAPIGNTPLLERTCNQLAAYKVRPTIVTHDDTIIRFLGGKPCNVYRPAVHKWIVQTLLSAEPLWSYRTVVLLGDVVFHDDDLAKVMEQTPHTTIYHNADMGELFAIQFDQQDMERVRAVLAQTVADAQANECAGKMWDWYHRIRETGGIRAVRLSRTMDIDTLEDYRNVSTIYSKSRQGLAQARP